MPDQPEQTQRYFDTLIESYEILAAAGKQAAERGLKLGQQLNEDVTAAQREALELSKKVAAEPGDMSRAYSAMLESTLAAQGRALNFAQLLTQEALDASSETRETLDRLTQANRETAEAAVAAFRDFAAAGPMTDLFKQAWSGFGAAAEPAQPKRRRSASA